MGFVKWEEVDAALFRRAVGSGADVGVLFAGASVTVNPVQVLMPVAHDPRPPRTRPVGDVHAAGRVVGSVGGDG